MLERFRINCGSIDLLYIAQVGLYLSTIEYFFDEERTTRRMNVEEAIIFRVDDVDDVLFD